MPLYTYRCHDCGATMREFRKIAGRDLVPVCSCFEESNVTRIVEAPSVTVDMQPYKSMITGEMITSRSQHRAHLKAHNCIEIGNETKYLKPKEKIDLAPESKKARKQKIIDQVNALK